MPAATSTTWPRNHQQSNATPTRQVRTQSPPLSAYSFSQTATLAQSKANIVSRAVIEGKVKKDQDGASVRMYLKLSVPLDTLTSTTIPLFAEENIKVLNSQVHPLDTNSAPYNFSSSSSPLLHKASRALSLPARLNREYMSLYDDVGASGIPTHNRATSSTKSGRRLASQESNSTLDAKYAGQITVSDYHVVFVLPKEFPPQHGLEDRDDDGSYLSRINPAMSTGASKRRVSVSERSALQFMVAIEMWIPYTTKPPRAPFLLSIPTPPRCLHNSIRLHIYSPTLPASNSFASLSSVEDESTSAWDISSEPQVSRNSTRVSRGSSYNDLADDESSDSSILAEGSGIYGSFPSTDRIHVRWAKPTKIFVNPDTDTRRRVGVEQSAGQMVCHVLDRQENGEGRPAGIAMHVEYEGRVAGVWYSGVETLLGLDINLESKNSEVSWQPGSTSWVVEGGTGFTGWNFGSSPPLLSRQASRDSLSSLNVISSLSNGYPQNVRHDSNHSTSSLLRAPLPNQVVPEYSFEGSATPDGSGISSYPSSMPASAIYDTVKSSQGDEVTPPGAPLTIHLNMSDLTPSSKGSLNSFTYKIFGTIVVTPRPTASASRPTHRQHTDEHIDDPVSLPKFTVLAADKESTSWVVKNETEPADSSTINVEVYSLSGDIRDAQSRKTVLRKGSSTRCGEEGARLVLRTLRPTRSKANARAAPEDTSVEHRTPRLTSSMVLRPSPAPETPVQPLRQGPLMIPWMVMTVTPLITIPSLGNAPSEHAVQLTLPIVLEDRDEWLAFGVPHLASSDKAAQSPVDIVCASVDGIPVRYERSIPRGKHKDFDQGASQHGTNIMVTELRIQAGTTGRNLMLEYIVEQSQEMSSRKEEIAWEAALPILPLPVGRLEVIVQHPTGFDTRVISNLQREVTHPSGHRLMHWSMDKGFRPVIQISLHSDKPPKTAASRVPWKGVVGVTFGLLLTTTWLILLFSMLSMDAEFRLMKQALVQIARQPPQPPPAPSWSPPPLPETRTITTTVFAHSTSRVRPSQEVEPTPSSSISLIFSTTSTSTPIATASVIDIRQSESTTNAPAVPPRAPGTEIDNGLAPLFQLPLDWNLHFDLPPVAEETVEKVMIGLQKTWQIIRRLYHYPLPPPP